MEKLSQYFLWWNFYCKFNRIFYTVYPCWLKVAISKHCYWPQIFERYWICTNINIKKKNNNMKIAWCVFFVSSLLSLTRKKVTFFFSSVISLTRWTVISVIYLDLPKTASFRSLFCCDSRCGTLHCHTQESRRPVLSVYDEGRKSHSPGVLPRIIWPCGWVSLQWNHGRFRSKGCLKGNNPLVPTSLISHIFTNNKGV